MPYELWIGVELDGNYGVSKGKTNKPGRALVASWLLNCCQQRWHEQDALEMRLLSVCRSANLPLCFSYQF